MAAMEEVDVELGSPVSDDQLHFQDIPHDIRTAPATTEATNVQTHTFSDFPNAHDSDDEDHGDKADLLKGEKKSSSFWTFEYYQSFFDVDTRQVMMRILGSMLPNPKANYLQHQIRPNPDLYGPFWICTTLIFTTAIAGNLSNYIQNAGKDYEWRYDFHKVTFAATAIYGYWWIVPTIFWAIFLWRKSPAGFTFLEMICVYGYSLAIFIPISILWVVQFNWFQWMLVIVGTVLSGGVLVLTLWPAVSQDSKQVAAIVIAFVVLFHLLLAIGFELYFFHVPDNGSSSMNSTVAVPTSNPLRHQPNAHTVAAVSKGLPTTLKTLLKAANGTKTS